MCGAYDADWSMALCLLETRARRGWWRQIVRGEFESIPGACVPHANLSLRTGYLILEVVPFSGWR